jgi:flagellar protein FlaF
MPPGKHNQPHNPYASAAGAYGTNAQRHAEDPRELEARVLLKSAQFMQDLQNGWDQRPKEALEDTLKYNRNIWLMFYDTAVENKEGEQRPDDLRNNIYSLANFVFKRELDILAKPEKKKLDILIKINRDIASGLLNGVRASVQAAKAATPAPAQPETAEAKKPPSGGWDSSA